MKIPKETYVMIHSIVLNPAERAETIPDDTKKVPLEIRIKGFLQDESEIGDNVEIITATGRKAAGKLIEANPAYTHSFGECIPETLHIGKQLREILEGEKA